MKQVPTVSSPVTVLSIAGSDPTGGAGLQADLQVFASLGVHGAAVVTAVTVQDTCGVEAYETCRAGLVRRQLEALLADVPVRAIKVGMLGDRDGVEAVAERLLGLQGVPVIVDPIFRAGSGAPLLSDEGIEALKAHLIPLATLITPNLGEAERLTGRPVQTGEDMRRAACEIAGRGPAAVVTGGHLEGEPVDVLCAGGETWELGGERIVLPRRVHGTGCAFSSAAAVFLALGDDVPTAVGKAKRYVAAGLRRAHPIGRGALVIDFRAAAADVLS